VAWVESRIRLAETSIEDLYRRIVDLTNQLRMLAQQLRALNQQQPSAGGGGEGGGIFVVLVPSALGGNPPTSIGSFSAIVYQVAGGALVSKGTQNCLIAIPGPTVAGKWGYCVPTGDGDYVLISQSCN
jgi:hypothetical protein